MPGNGFTAANGFTVLSLTDPETLRATVGSILYLALIGLLSLGMATLIRDSAVAVGVVLGMLYLFPILIQVVGDPDWKRRLEQIAPTMRASAFSRPSTCRASRSAPGWGWVSLRRGPPAAMVAAAVMLRWRDA